jgi:hypothetical protein
MSLIPGLKAGVTERYLLWQLTEVWGTIRPIFRPLILDEVIY